MFICTQMADAKITFSTHDENSIEWSVVSYIPLKWRKASLITFSLLKRENFMCFWSWKVFKKFSKNEANIKLEALDVRDASATEKWDFVQSSTVRNFTSSPWIIWWQIAWINLNNKMKLYSNFASQPLAIILNYFN